MQPRLSGDVRSCARGSRKTALWFMLLGYTCLMTWRLSKLRTQRGSRIRAKRLICGGAGRGTLRCNTLCREIGKFCPQAAKPTKSSRSPPRGPRCGPGVVVEHDRDLKVPCVTQWCFRAGNQAPRPDFGRMLVGRASKSDLRPAFGRPEIRFRDSPD